MGVSLGVEGGALVVADARGSAKDAGLRAGDRVVAVGGRPAARLDPRGAAALVVAARDAGAAEIAFVVERRDDQGGNQSFAAPSRCILSPDLTKCTFPKAESRLTELVPALGDDGERPARSRASSAADPPAAPAASARETALEAELAATKDALAKAAAVARTLGETHEAALARERARDARAGDASARADDLEKELVEAKMALAQTALEYGELKIKLRDATAAAPAPAPPGKKSFFSRRSKSPAP